MILLADELDVSYAGRLGIALADAVARNDEVGVDVSAVRLIDSSCIRELLRDPNCATFAPSVTSNRSAWTSAAPTRVNFRWTVKDARYSYTATRRPGC